MTAKGEEGTGWISTTASKKQVSRNLTKYPRRKHRFIPNIAWIALEFPAAVMRIPM
jgi:hypothetical protein